jgi:cell wall assembly regulator SMI1
MTNEAFDLLWASILARVELLHGAAARWGLIGNWGDQNSMVVKLLPPASADEIAEAEAAMGEPLPTALRQLFTRGAAGMEIMWSWPGALLEQPGGWVEVELQDQPDIEPFLSGTYLAWSLNELIELHADWQEACEDLTKRIEFEPEEADWHRFYSDFWARGFPFMTGQNGDVIALDRNDPEGALLILNHEGDVPPGWFLRHNPIEMLEQLSRIGFASIDHGNMELFRLTDSSEAVVEASPGVDADWLPTELILDATCPAAQRWSRFFYATPN